MADGVAALIIESRRSTPLALGVESGWGMGKSTLMRQLERILVDRDDIETVWFNAWTAVEGDALEGLIKSVLNRLDRNVIRRALRSEKLLSWGRLLLHALADLLRIGSLVDAFWREVELDPKVRNEARAVVTRSIKEWSGAKAELGPEKLLVVFIDDLDRCSPPNVIQVFEAIKLYLDAPGMVFVIGYDPEVVTDAVLNLRQYSETRTSYRYLEKIIQLAYPLPHLGDDAAERLVASYLAESRTGPLFDDTVRGLVVQQSGRNPRRIKRFINSFVLEYGLDAEWEGLGAGSLVLVLVIDLYFPDFGRLLRATDVERPVERFRQYADVRERLRREIRKDDPDGWGPVKDLMQAYGLTWSPEGMKQDELLTRIEQEVPAPFVSLARSPDFKSLVRTLPDMEPLRPKLRRYVPTSLRTSPRSTSHEDVLDEFRIQVEMSPLLFELH